MREGCEKGKGAFLLKVGNGILFTEAEIGDLIFWVEDMESDGASILRLHL